MIYGKFHSKNTTLLLKGLLKTNHNIHQVLPKSRILNNRVATLWWGLWQNKQELKNCNISEQQNIYARSHGVGSSKTPLSLAISKSSLGLNRFQTDWNELAKLITWETIRMDWVFDTCHLINFKQKLLDFPNRSFTNVLLESGLLRVIEYGYDVRCPLMNEDKIR